MIIKGVLAALTAVSMLTACAGAPSGSGSVTDKVSEVISEVTADIAAGTTDSGSGEEAAPDTSGIAGPTTEETEMSEEVKYIALTFDDGPNSTTTNEVIDKLEKYGIVASFFLVGNNIDDESAKQPAGAERGSKREHR